MHLPLTEQDNSFSRSTGAGLSSAMDFLLYKVDQERLAEGR